MKVRDLLGEPKEPWRDKLCECDLIALDGKTGKILFDTSKNKREYIEKFYNGDILSLWGDMVSRGSQLFPYYKPVVKCYVSHGSWEVNE